FPAASLTPEDVRSDRPEFPEKMRSEFTEPALDILLSRGGSDSGDQALRRRADLMPPPHHCEPPEQQKRGQAQPCPHAAQPRKRRRGRTRASLDVVQGIERLLVVSVLRRDPDVRVARHATVHE